MSYQSGDFHRTKLISMIVVDMSWHASLHVACWYVYKQICIEYTYAVQWGLYWPLRYESALDSCNKLFGK
jgi:hypothetical protein